MLPWVPTYIALIVAVLASWLSVALGSFSPDAVRTAFEHRVFLFLAGSALAVVAWNLFRQIRRGHPCSLREALLMQGIAGFALPLTSNDIFSNMAYGHLANLGFNPYLTTPGALPGSDAFRALVGSRWLTTPTAYGPLIANINTVLGYLPTPTSSFLGQKLVVLAFTMAATALAWRNSNRNSEQRVAFTLFACSPALLWELCGQNHNDAVMLLGMTVFVLAARAEREMLAILAITAACCAKVAVAPVGILYLIVIARKRPLVALGYAVAGALLLIALVLPYWTGPEVLRGPGGTFGGDVNRTARSIGGFFCYLAKHWYPPVRPSLYRLSLAANAIVVAGLCVRAAFRVRNVDDVFRHGWLITFAYLLTAPWFMPWYATWLLPFFLVIEVPALSVASTWYGILPQVEYALPTDPVTSIAIHGFIAWKFWKKPRIKP